MGFVAAVRACLSRYATFSGRARRPEYWWFLLFTLLVGALASLIDTALGTGSADGGLVSAVTGLGLLPPMLAVTWRRLHDVGRSGWFALLPYGAGVVSGLMLVALAASVEPGAGPPSLALRILGPAAALATLASFVLVFVWLVSKSRPGPNRFGPEPSPA
jgi:uncharacterized membrane protein YhaH (DUF805 family)